MKPIEEFERIYGEAAVEDELIVTSHPDEYDDLAALGLEVLKAYERREFIISGHNFIRLSEPCDAPETSVCKMVKQLREGS